MADLTKLSKFLAVLLRHRAAEFDLILDEQGFTDVDAVWAQIQQRYPNRYRYEDLLKVVEGDEHGKKRYEIVGTRIRAMYGHSKGIDQVISYEPAVPPEILYHGTSATVIEAIQREGLKAQNRQYVHFATHTERALRVGARHSGETVILRVRALDAHAAGIVWYHAEAEHYLAEYVLPEFIEFP
jgi:putative RNA 2'-phosphotransferase